KRSVMLMDVRRKESERTFHNKRYGGDSDPRESLGRWYAAVSSGSQRQIEAIKSAARNASVLEYGCADGRLSLLEQDLAGASRAFCGMDVWDQAIARARQTAAGRGLTQCRFDVMDAEAMTFADEAFDFVFGRGILPHLDLAKC